MGLTYVSKSRTWCMGSGTIPGPKDVWGSRQTIQRGECGRGLVAVRSRGGTIAHHSPPRRRAVMRGEGTCAKAPEDAHESPGHCVHPRARHHDLVCCWCGDLFVADGDVSGPHGQYKPRRKGS